MTKIHPGPPLSPSLSRRASKASLTFIRTWSCSKQNHMVSSINRDATFKASVAKPPTKLTILLHNPMIHLISIAPNGYSKTWS